MLETLQIIILFCTVGTGHRDYDHMLEVKKKCIKEVYVCLDKDKSNEGLRKCLTQ